MRKLVSVVVTTKNEEQNIESCLQSIKNQTWSPLEIIVVDNFSTDKTKDLSLKYTPLVYDKGPERSAQRNYGMSEIAKGEYLMFIDADMTLSPGLVEECMNFVQKSDVVALHIPEVILGDGFWCQVRRFEREFYDGTVIDGARFFRADTFKKLGGFDETIYAAEDWDLDKRLKKNGPIGLLDRNKQSVLYHNEAHFRLGHYLKKKKYYTQNFDLYFQKWGASDPDLKKQFGLGYRYFFVFFEKGKWRRLFRHPILTGGMYLLRILVGITFVFRKIN